MQKLTYWLTQRKSRMKKETAEFIMEKIGELVLRETIRAARFALNFALEAFLDPELSQNSNNIQAVEVYYRIRHVHGL